MLNSSCKGLGATGLARDKESVFGLLHLVLTWLQVKFEIWEEGSLGQVGDLLSFLVFLTRSGRNLIFIHSQ